MNPSSRLSLPLWNERYAAPLAPVSGAEMRARGWDYVDVVFVSGDAYVDHPSFAAALLTRVLEAEGFRVAVLPQPDWRSCEPWRQFGRPRLFFAVSAGNMDSLINHYTANKKVRNDDAYSPGGRIGLRPDRATLPYCHRAREAFPGVPVIAGGVEASLRRLAHYDYWSDTVRKAILFDCKADLLAYGMGEETIVEIARRLAAGQTVRDLRDLRGVAYALGAREAAAMVSRDPKGSAERALPFGSRLTGQDSIVLPSYEEVKADKLTFAEATRLIHINTNPHNAKTLVQFHDREAVVVNPPCLPLPQAEMDRVYDLPYTRRPHPSYREPVPAFEMIKDSVTIMRGCFGGCTFCSITAHQGRIIQSRSQESVMKEVRKMAADPEFSGVVSDIGGPTANMYEMVCTRPEVEAKCKRLSCVHPTICKLLGTDHGPLVELMRRARTEPGIRKVLVASGVRMDLAQRSPEYMRELAEHHVGGHLKVAPEHTDSTVLGLMKKPDNGDFQGFAREFAEASREGGKPKQFLVPYYISSHPGSDLHAMIDLALFLKRNGYRPDQVQDFIPAPFDIATCMYYTGIDPFTKEEVYIARNLRDRKMQRALLQFFKPENWFTVREALIEAGRADLIGSGCDCLIPAQPPKEAIEARRGRANDPDHYHTVANPTSGEKPGERGAVPLKTKGYRPGRKGARRQDRRPKHKGGGLEYAALVATGPPCGERYAVRRRKLSDKKPARIAWTLWGSRMTKSMPPPVRRVKASAGPEASLYERIGAEKVERLVAAFYARVDSDPVIRPLYGKTLTCAIRGLTDFMTTWLGGPPVYDLRGARLRRRHVPFAIDARARDAWLANMKAAVREVGIPAAEAGLLLAHLEFGAGALLNTGETPEKAPCPDGTDRFDARLAERWNRMAEAENLFDAVSRGDLALMRSMLPMRLAPHAELMSHALAEWLDPTDRADRRYGRRPKQVKPLEVIESLLAHGDLDTDPTDGDDLGRFRHLQAMIEAYTGVSRMIAPDSPLHAVLRAATRDRFISVVERDRSCVRLLGLRGQSLLHDAALFGDAELAAVLIRSGADPDGREAEGHTPLYRASTGDVARVLLAAGATADAASGPTRGTALHQAARRGNVSVAQALLEHGATIDARDAKEQTPLRRAVNCRQLQIVRLLVRHGADPHAADRRGVTPLDVARTTEMKQALGDAGA